MAEYFFLPFVMKSYYDKMNGESSYVDYSKNKATMEKKLLTVDFYLYYHGSLDSLFSLLVPCYFLYLLVFFKWDYMRDLEFIGFANYIKAIFNDQYAINGMKLTIKFVTFAVPLQLALAILIASLLNTKLKGTKVVRTMVYLPVVLSGAVAGQMWKYMYSEDFGGVINYFLSFLGVQVSWLTDFNMALYSVALTGIWAVGIPMILFLAGLKAIPKTYYESAEIDGAGAFARFFFTLHYLY